jgi:hypothetical protein
MVNSSGSISTGLGDDLASGVRQVAALGLGKGGKPRLPISEGRRISASSPNAADALNSKLSAIQTAQAEAARVRNLPDGRIRYYTREVPANKPGLTRGASLVTEHNPRTGQVRVWYENYDHSGNVIRVHPKAENGLSLNSGHYPPTGKELGR